VKHVEKRLLSCLLLLTHITKRASQIWASIWDLKVQIGEESTNETLNCHHPSHLFFPSSMALDSFGILEI
jgi:hypothetical protein